MLRLFSPLCAVVAASLAAASIGAATPAAAQSRIGVAAAVLNEVTGSLPGDQRRLSTGDGVRQNEVIRTAGDASTQLLFRDETALSIGPSSEVTLDRFVFDPSGSATSVAVNLSKGALRFVSGASDPRRYQVKTPLAVIGLRGTVIDVRYVDGKVYVILTEGATDVCVNGGRCVSVTRPGDAVVIGQGGTIDGPKVWDGRIYQKAGLTSWPLFGYRFENDRTRDTVAPGLRSGGILRGQTESLPTGGGE
jgi:hypothetical protein